MTDREKLIELILNVPVSEVIGSDKNRHKVPVPVSFVADHLIAHGVTIQPLTNCQQLVAYKWISTAERLPEVVDTYLVVVISKYDHEKEYSIDTDVATYDPHEGGYIDNCWNTYNDWDEGQQYLHVTHWMPLPTPPKEE